MQTSILTIFAKFSSFKHTFLAKLRKLSPTKYARSIFAKLSSRENK